MTKAEQLAKAVPDLKVAVEEYGLSMPWSDIVDFKIVNHSLHRYCAMLFKVGDGHDIVDFAKGDVWECQNDSCGGVTPAQFKKMRIVEGCDDLEGWPDDRT